MAYNNLRPIDLHMHSTRSDGTLTPTELVTLAAKKSLSAFALTDHDSTNGIAEAMEAAKGTNIEVVPGIEFSTEYNGRDVHIVGLYYDWQDPAFREEVKVFTEERTRRNRRMCEIMAADGIAISYEELVAANPDSVITRANIASFLMDRHVVVNRKEAFDRLIGDGCKYFIPREKISPEKAIAFTLRYHGIPILAHPFQYELGDEGLETLVRRLTEAGLVGIEAYYCNHTEEMTRKVMTLAKKYGLLLSGGSDFHGKNKPGLEMGNGYGHLRVPGELLVRMKQYLSNTRDNNQ
jgi:predicted metal-dependent phosphoesterase TrpH